MAIGKTQIKSMIIEFAESPHLPDDIQGDMLIAGYFGHVIDRCGWDIDGAGHRLTDAGGGGRVPNDLLALADLSGQVPMVCRARNCPWSPAMGESFLFPMKILSPSR